MIKNVSIRNFKSIKELDFKAKRVNVFIGEPNTGKSNILEALGMFSLVHHYKGDIPIRYNEASNLFYNNLPYPTNEPSVQADQYYYGIDLKNMRAFEKRSDEIMDELFEFGLNDEHLNVLMRPEDQDSFPFKFYSFKTLHRYIAMEKYLTPPYGRNLFDILLTNRELKSLVSSLLKEKGYRLGLRMKDKEIEIIKEVDEVLYTFPYQTLSDTLQRVIFFWAVIETNKNATILLEEPESHMSANHIRDIAERIALDTDNQYFLVTHNPYFLTTITEKTKPKDLAIFVTRLDDYQTQLTQLTPDHITELLDLDSAVFLNLDKLVTLESVH